MKVIATAETSRKNGRRTYSGVSCSRPHAPPRFFASTKSRCPLMSSTGGKMASGRSSLRSAQSLLPRSAASVTLETIARNRNDGRAVDTFSAGSVVVGSPVGGPAAMGAAGLSVSGSDDVLSRSVIREGKYGRFGEKWSGGGARAGELERGLFIYDTLPR